LSQLSEEQKENVFRFKKPFPYREISIIYYKPTFKQKIIDELALSIKKSLELKLNYHVNPKEFVSIKPQ
jgi:LysR family hydrogen peroxide-inducible transcriptional activator